MTQPGYLAHAEEAYRKSLTLATVAPAEVRSQAHLGLAYALERSVAGLDAETRQEIVRPITPWLFSMETPFWRKVKKWMPIGRPKSGFVAIRILERLKRYREAIGLCDELARQYPGLKNGLAIRRKRLEELQAEARSLACIIEIRYN